MKGHVKFILTPILVVSLGLLNKVNGQQSSEYFNFWKEGLWKSEITIYNKDTIPEKDSFAVHKLQNKNAFNEKWKIFIGEGEYVDAMVTRAYDQETKRWKLFYVDDVNAQIWDSEIIEDRIYFIKKFTYDGNTFYSRQAWSLESEDQVLRTIERSEDKKNWSIRYWQIFKLVNQ
ncbi:MAG: hypothetical protein ACR2MT_16425 [Aurantibacter sp.]